MDSTTASCGHSITAVGASNSIARTLACSIPCQGCQDRDNASGIKWKPCPACGYVYNCTKLLPPRVPVDIRCACCCR